MGADALHEGGTASRYRVPAGHGREKEARRRLMPCTSARAHAHAHAHAHVHACVHATRTRDTLGGLSEPYPYLPLRTVPSE